MLHKPLKNLFSSTISQALEDGINAIALAVRLFFSFLTFWMHVVEIASYYLLILA